MISVQQTSDMQTLQKEIIELLKELIATPSFSKEEDQTASLLISFLAKKNIAIERELNNIWALNLHFDPSKPSILLNSHHDTVKPNTGYTRDPFLAEVIDGKLYGLGSNDAGASLVCLLGVFCHYYAEPNLPYNLIFAASSEEEISGKNGMELIFPKLPPIHFAIVGEPTCMELAIAEKGLIVVDCIAHGKSGHAAREEGENAIYKAIQDIQWLQTYQFSKVSQLLGPIKTSVTIIQAGTQHNVIPDSCQFTIDIRVTDVYKNEEIVEILKDHFQSEVIPRSVRLKPSSIAMDHPIVIAGQKMGKKTYASPTTSDQALMYCPSLKMGPGDSARSHTADEFVFIEEIEKGLEEYIELLDHILITQ